MGLTRRHILLASLASGIGLAATLLGLEILLRFLPVNTGLQSSPVDSLHPIQRFAPSRSFVYSKGWNFRLVNRGRTNNAGWINDDDYDSTATSPLLAVVGDSYIAAEMVPPAETIHGRLATCLKPNGRAYSFGASGTALAQYLAVAAHARDLYRPDGFVFVVVGNDFDGSTQPNPGTHHFRPDGSLERTDYQPSKVRRALRHSALVRYVLLNLSGGLDGIRRVLSPPKGGRYVGNTPAEYTPERLEKAQMAVRRFLDQLPEYAGVDPARILIVVDAMRPELYDSAAFASARGSFFDVMRRYLLEEAGKRKYEIIDMEPRFRRLGGRFESVHDNHWDGRGHGAVAGAVAESKMFREIFPEACRGLPSTIGQAE